MQARRPNEPAFSAAVPR